MGLSAIHHVHEKKQKVKKTQQKEHPGAKFSRGAPLAPVRSVLLCSKSENKIWDWSPQSQGSPRDGAGTGVPSPRMVLGLESPVEGRDIRGG